MGIERGLRNALGTIGAVAFTEAAFTEAQKAFLNPDYNPNMLYEIFESNAVALGGALLAGALYMATRNPDKGRYVDGDEMRGWMIGGAVMAMFANSVYEAFRIMEHTNGMLV